MVTIKDIAKRAGVSPSTISRALNDNPLVNKQKRRRIKVIATNMGYRKNEVARGLTKGSLPVIGLVIPDITNPFFAEVARGVEDMANRRGFMVILCNTDEDLEKEKRYERFLLRHMVGGLILTSSTEDDPCIKELISEKVPLILISRIVKSTDVSYVVSDDVGGAKMAVEHLIGLGHQKIGFIGGPPNVTPSQRRMQGYRETLALHNIQFQEEIAKYGEFTRESGYRVMKEYLELIFPPTAIFAANDLIALGAIEAVEEIGLSVPENVAVVGYNDISYASLPGILLTTISQPGYQMGTVAAKYILDVVEGKREKKLRKVLKPKLIARKTCGTVKIHCS